MRFMSDFREAMWGVVQSAVSELDFDFDDYAAKHFERLRETAADPRFDTWLEEAACPRAELPDSARCVIIGGGVGGTSIAYHLAQLGYGRRGAAGARQLTSGSTFHSAGLVGQLRGSVSLTRMMMYSVELYRRLGESRSSTPAGSSAAASGWPPARSGWRSCAARRGGRRRSACRWS